MPVETDILPPRYRDPERIARGGMGEIYRATDEALGRTVAVKVLAPELSEDETVRSRFKREALTGAKLSGEPHVVTIFDVGEHEGRPYIVMAYLPGGSLQDELRRGAPPTPEALEWLDQAARALDAAHAAGIVHRDVKPANLLLDGSRDVHVADFGIASAAGHDSMTKTGTVLGTASYLAPEQARGERTTPASDRYALAVVAFELLTGSRPFAGDTPAAEASAHVHAAIPAASSKRRDLPRHVDAVFRRGLAKVPAERYDSCAELVASLRQALSEAAGETRETRAVATPPPTRPVPRRGRRAWVPLLLGALVLAGAAGIAAAAMLAGGDGEDAPTAPQATTVVQTRTADGTTVVETETVVTTAPAEEEEPPSEGGGGNGGGGGGSSGASGVELNDRGWSLMQQGRFGDALPVLQQAVEKLSGSGELAEAYALYNLSQTLLELERCEESIPEMLDRSEAIQGRRAEIDRARERYAAQCG